MSRISVSLPPLTAPLGEIGFDATEYSGKAISKYSTSKLFKYGFVNPKGSVFTRGMVLRTVVMCLIATFVAFFRCPDKGMKPYQFCFPILSSGEGLIFASLVSFLLGLFQSTTFSRWWSTREKLGVCMNNTAYATMLLSNFSTNDPNAKAAAERIARWMNAAHALIYKQANKDFDLHPLVQKNLLTNEEREKLEHASTSMSNVAAIVFNWCFGGLKEMTTANQVLSSVFTPTLSAISAAFTASQDIFTFLDTQMPFSYLHLLTVITKIHLVFVVFYSGGIVGSGMATLSWSRIIFGYAMVFTNNLIYEGLLLIHDMLVNPLGDESGDFPKELYQHQTAQLCDAILNGGVPKQSQTISLH